MAKTKKAEDAPKEPKERPKRAVSKRILPAKKQAEVKTPSKKVVDVPKSPMASSIPSPHKQGSSNAAAYTKPKEKPKKAMSAYFHFANAMRPEIVKKVGSNNPTVLMTAAGTVLLLLRRSTAYVRAEWTALKDKSKWEKIAAEDKERYDIECMEYNGVVFSTPCPF
ncbi:high mobility group-T protein-like protein [Aphelenchoides avenae]|nr:high mobility group-T protein-like protein [Aphelenchus avenae]